MNRGVIVDNHISVVSKIPLKYKKNKVVFSCCTPLCTEGIIVKGKSYKVKLLIPVELFPEAEVRTFYGVGSDEHIRAKIIDVKNEENIIPICFRIGDKVKTHYKMYCLETVFSADEYICDPVFFMCGTLIRKHQICHCLTSDNNAIGIKLFIEEVVDDTNPQ